MNVSVVIPARPGSPLLADCVKALLEQTYDTREIVVVIDGHGAPSLPGVQVIERERPGGAGAARNTGANAATGELICFIDDDALAPPHWLSALADGAARHPGAGILGGPVRPLYEAPPPRTCPRHDLSGGVLDEASEEIEIDEVWGCNMAVRRSAMEALGGFDEHLRLSEDWDFGRRLIAAGGRIVYLPDAWIEHRRLADDLHVRGMPLEHLRRGWLTGMRFPEAPDPRANATWARRSVGHALRTRCTRGLTDAAKGSGLALAGLARRLGARPR